ncbi:hypothetical protein [Metasolibacillus meyeri]|nr:hypothetical protein [Metasolibacillus meyeri]
MSCWRFLIHPAINRQQSIGTEIPSILCPTKIHAIQELLETGTIS